MAFVAGVLLAAFVVANIARGQGGAYEPVPGTPGGAVISECHPDLLALGLRFRCSATVSWPDGRVVQDDVYSPGDVAGQTVEVRQATSFELKLGRTTGSGQGPVLRTLTLDHPVGSRLWTVVGYVGPPAIPFLAVGVLWVVYKLCDPRERRRRRRRSRHSPGA